VNLGKFGELEEKIKGIIEDYALLKRKNQELDESLKKKELELGEANNEIRGLNEERETIRTKVDLLLELLQDMSTPR
jgi:chromosome segregation ATPase